VSGLDFQSQLANAGVQIPIVFITGHGDIPMTVKAMKSGAVEFLTKPFLDRDLLGAINQALARDRATRQQQGNFAERRERYESLTTRERQAWALSSRACSISRGCYLRTKMGGEDGRRVWVVDQWMLSVCCPPAATEMSPVHNQIATIMP